MDFIDEAIEKQRIRLSTGKAKQKAEKEEEKEEAGKRDQEIREQVDQCISEIVFPVVCKAKKRFEQNDFKAEADIDTSTSLDIGKSYSKGAKLQLHKSIDRRAGVPIVIGPSLSFSASPPYSTTIAIVAYGKDNTAIFSERWEITEMTEKLVESYIKRFVEEVVK